MKRSFLLLFGVLAVGCSSAPSPKPPVEQGNAARAPSCGSACEHLRLLGCSIGKVTPRGASCETVCDNVQLQNAGAGFSVACLARAKTCAIADACR